MKRKGRGRKGKEGKGSQDETRLYKAREHLALEIFLVPSSSLHESFLDFTELFNICLPLVYLTCFHKFLFFFSGAYYNYHRSKYTRHKNPQLINRILNFYLLAS